MGDNLIPVKISVNDIEIRNIEKSELNEVLLCVNESEDSFSVLGRTKPFTYNDIEQRYLETLISSLEFFCGVYLNGSIIGIIKGRIESKNCNELWILSFLLSGKYRGKGMGSNVLEAFENYFLHNYSIEKFCVLTYENNKRSHEFWKKNNYKLARITKTSNEVELSMVIFEKK